MLDRERASHPEGLPSEFQAMIPTRIKALRGRFTSLGI